MYFKWINSIWSCYVVVGDLANLRSIASSKIKKFVRSKSWRLVSSLRFCYVTKHQSFNFVHSIFICVIYIIPQMCESSFNIPIWLFEYFLHDWFSISTFSNFWKSLLAHQKNSSTTQERRHQINVLKSPKLNLKFGWKKMNT